jgi:hypothetical protein
LLDDAVRIQRSFTPILQSSNESFNILVREQIEYRNGRNVAAMNNVERATRMIAYMGRPDLKATCFL